MPRSPEEVEEKQQAELAYQASRAQVIARVGRTPDYIIDRYRRHRWWRFFPKEFLFKRMWDVGFHDAHILDFGCGEGEITTQLARLGGRVTGMDISAELIEIAKERAAADQVLDRVRFRVGDVRQIGPDQCFDFLICFAVLHHLDLYSVLPRLVACLKPGGVATFVEPIAFSPLLERVRDLLPIKKDASPGERQLTRRDVQFMLRHLEDPQRVYFNLLGRASRLFPYANQIDRNHFLSKAALIAIHGLDHLLLALFPALSRWAGTIVIVGRKPAAGGPDPGRESQFHRREFTAPFAAGKVPGFGQ